VSSVSYELGFYIPEDAIHQLKLVFTAECILYTLLCSHQTCVIEFETSATSESSSGE
jgi:hypothetical protein